MDIRTLAGNKVNNGSLSIKKFHILYSNAGTLLERRKAIPPMDESMGFLA
jgi:hypothetical protein